MAIDADRLTSSKVSWTLKRQYSPMVREAMRWATPQTAFMNDKPFEFNAGDRMVLPITNAPAGGVVFVDATSDQWPAAARSYGQSLQITPSNLKEIGGTMNIELKSREVLSNSGAAVGDQLKREMKNLAEDAVRKAALSTMTDPGGRICLANGTGQGAIAGTGYFAVDGDLPHILAPGWRVCGGTSAASTTLGGSVCNSVDWNCVISDVDHVNKYVYWQNDTLLSGTGDTTEVSSVATIADNDGVWLFDAANDTDSNPGMYGIQSWMNNTFTNYNVTRTTSDWNFFSASTSSAGSAAITLDTLENAIIYHNMQTGGDRRDNLDMGIVSPAVFQDIAHLEDDKKRLNLDPQQAPDFILGYNRIWIMAGTGQVPLVVDPTFFDDRIYFLSKADWYRVNLKPFGFESHGENGSPWYTDATYFLKKAHAWASYNFVCLNPKAQFAITDITT